MHHTGALKSIFQFFGTVPTANEIAAGRHASRPDIDHLSQSLDYKVGHPRHLTGSVNQCYPGYTCNVL